MAGLLLIGPATADKGTLANRAQLIEKRHVLERKWTQKHIRSEISPILIGGARLGQMKLVKPLAAKASARFGLSESETATLNEVPYRGTPMPPLDPLIGRFYEFVMVNGPAWKALIEVEFGDGMMSAINFALEREPNPKGDRVRFVMSGKFLPFKYYRAEQGLQDTVSRNRSERGGQGASVEPARREGRAWGG